MKILIWCVVVLLGVEVGQMMRLPEWASIGFGWGSAYLLWLLCGYISRAKEGTVKCIYCGWMTPVKPTVPTKETTL